MFTSSHLSHVMVMVSHVLCHISCVTCHRLLARGHFKKKFIPDKVVRLVCKGLISTGPTLSSFLHGKRSQLHKRDPNNWTFILVYMKIIKFPKERVLFIKSNLVFLIICQFYQLFTLQNESLVFVLVLAFCVLWKSASRTANIVNRSPACVHPLSFPTCAVEHPNLNCSYLIFPLINSFYMLGNNNFNW